MRSKFRTNDGTNSPPLSLSFSANQRRNHTHTPDLRSTSVIFQQTQATCHGTLYDSHRRRRAFPGLAAYSWRSSPRRCSREAPRRTDGHHPLPAAVEIRTAAAVHERTNDHSDVRPEARAHSDDRMQKTLLHQMTLYRQKSLISGERPSSLFRR